MCFRDFADKTVSVVEANSTNLREMTVPLPGANFSLNCSKETDVHGLGADSTMIAMGLSAERGAFH